MRVDAFDFELPPERIALRPARPRDAARMLVVEPGAMTDAGVRDLPSWLRAGDCLVFNDTRVIPAQLEGRRGEARIGATLHKRIDLRRWQAFVRNAKRLRIGEAIDFGAGVTAIAEERLRDGSFILAFGGNEPVEVLLERAGTMPLPPYIAGKRATDEADRSDYHVMHAEWGRIDAATADRLNAVRAKGGRVIAVGTTSLRLLESAARADDGIAPFEGDTAIFITPGYRFRAIDGLMTNFHLPRSTLFMLVSALMGLDTMQAAYTHAIAQDYRFYSYGDASLLLPRR